MSDRSTEGPTEGDRFADAVHFMDSAGWTVVFDDDLKQYICYDEAGAVFDPTPLATLSGVLAEVYLHLCEVSGGD